MKRTRRFAKIGLVLLTLGFSAASAFTQAPDPPPRERISPDNLPPDRGPGPGGPGGPPEPEMKVVPQFDQNKNGRLETNERKEARTFVVKERAERRRDRGPGGRRGPGGPPEEQSPDANKPALKLSPKEVKNFPDATLYDESTLRTFFLEFEAADWEKEMADFYNTDVEIPAKLTVDGKTYQDVGVHFRGASSFKMLRDGQKRSLNLSLDFVHEKQNVGGYRTLNLLNSHGDPSFLRTVLYNHISRAYIPTSKANLVRVVINGENWGVYTSAQQFNKDFINDAFGTTKGARWKVPGSPRGKGSLAYLGDDPQAYKGIYEIKSKDEPKSWAALIKLCKVLNETPADQLEKALSPLLDIDAALRFLALENTLVNNDGYWTRTSDYNIYLDEQGRFHLVPHDTNETFARPGGPGFRRRMGPPPADVPPQAAGGEPDRVVVRRFDGPGPGPEGMPRVDGVKLDPLVAANDPTKPLISKLLAVPTLRARYLTYVRDIAEKWLDWNQLGPVANRLHELIAEDVKADTRKLSSTEAFQKSLSGPANSSDRTITLKDFADQRRAYLLDLPAVKEAAAFKK